MYEDVHAGVVVSIERTAHGTYRARWRDAEGRQRAQSFPRKIDAERHLRRVHTDIERGTYVDPSASNITVRKMADEWITGAMNLRAGARETYQRDLERYVLPALGDAKLARLTPAAIDKYLSAELAAGLAPSSVHRHYRTLHRMLEVAVAKGRLARNPCGPVTPPRIPPSEMRFLDVDQVEQLARAITERHRAWALSAAYLGFRWSEGVGLRRGDVAGDRVTVAGQLLQRTDRSWDREEAKTKAGRRTIIAPPTVAAELAEHLEHAVAEPSDALVFTTATGRPLISSNFTATVFKPALERAGIDRNVRIHDLRHTAVALAIAVGAHPKAIQARMGHASISVTLDRYGHLFPVMEEAIAVGLDDLRATAKPRLHAV